MREGQHCLLTKLGESRPGILPVTHWSRGTLLAPITVGQPIKLLRYARAALESGEPESVSRPCLYESSPVIAISPPGGGRIQRITTRNSVWEVTPLEPLTDMEASLVSQGLEYHPDVSSAPFMATQSGLDTKPQP